MSGVRYEVVGRVALVTLDRPDRLNAMTNRMRADYRDALVAADADPAVRAAVVTGAGRGFCAGGDAAALDKMVATASYEAGDPDPEGIFAFQLRLGIPLVAAINGPAAGVGLVLACFCDRRFAAAGTKLTTSFARLGLPAEHGMSWLLPKIVGLPVAIDLLLSGRVVLAEEARDLGLVDEVHPPAELLPAALAYAENLAVTCAPGSRAAIKAQLYTDLRRDLAQSATDALARTQEMVRTEEFREGVAAFRERRSPSF